LLRTKVGVRSIIRKHQRQEFATILSKRANWSAGRYFFTFFW
jgi:hypothetical protein